MSNTKEASYVDSTVRLKWEITKEEFDSCEFDQGINSDIYEVKFGNESSEWVISIYPKGCDHGEDEDDEERRKATIYVTLVQGDKNYKVLYGFGIETNSGYWPNGDLVEKLYSRRGVDYDYLETMDEEKIQRMLGDTFCTTEEFSDQFVQNKVTLVATLVFHMEDSKQYLPQQRASNDFMEDVSTIKLQDNLSDITVICGEKQFPSHRNLLAARSKYFEAVFRNEPEKKEVKIEEASPEIVKDMLDFMSDGLIPVDIGAKAVDLVMLADMYRIESFSRVCLDSMVTNLTPDNVLDTLVIVDKLKHVAKKEQREQIFDFIGKEAANIVKAPNWEDFVRSYPSLVSDVVLAARKAQT